MYYKYVSCEVDRLSGNFSRHQNIKLHPTFDVVTEASVHAQFMLPLSKVRETKALVVASAIILTPLSVVFPVKVTTSCWTSFSRVADTVRS